MIHQIFLLGWLYCTFDISALFMIFSAAARLSSSVQPDAIIRTGCQVSRNPPSRHDNACSASKSQNSVVLSVQPRNPSSNFASRFELVVFERDAMVKISLLAFKIRARLPSLTTGYMGHGKIYYVGAQLPNKFRPANVCQITWRVLL